MLLIDAAHRPLDEPPLTLTTDCSQVRTRVFGQGHSESTLADVAFAQHVPVGNAEQFTVAGFTDDDGPMIRSGARLFQYDGIILGGAVTRSKGDVATSLAATSGSGQEPTPRISGGVPVAPFAQQYVVQFTTATGHGPANDFNAAVVYLTYPQASSNPTVTGTTGGAMAPGDYEYHFSLVTGNGESPLFGGHRSITLAAPNNAVSLAAPLLTDGRILKFNVYRRTAGVQALTLVFTLESEEVRVDKIAANALAGQSPSVTRGWEWGAVLLTGLTPGSDPRITGRTIYRRSYADRQYRALASIDNIVTEYLDTADESALGEVLEPWSTTAREAGAPYLAIDDDAGFPLRGWAAAGSAVIYYDKGEGFDLNVPASGPGSITAEIPYGTEVKLLPSLTNVRLLLFEGEAEPTPTGVMLRAGATVAVWVKRDDLAAQAAMAARAGGDDDGVYEYQITDDLAPAAMVARCDAELALYGAPLETAAFATLDRAAQSGQTVTINLAPVPIAASLMMQEVQISDIALSTRAAPRRTVTATSVRFTLENVLRRLTARLPT